MKEQIKAEHTMQTSWILFPLLFCLACASSLEEEAEQEEGSARSEANLQDFQEAMNSLQGEYGVGKADFFGVDPCKLLEPILEFGDQATRAAFFVGLEGGGALGLGRVLEGYDMVWDLYHQQMTVSRYVGAGIGGPGLGASLTAYTGLALGFQSGVADWNGYFVTTATELSLPFLKDFLSFNPAFFISGVDENEDHFIAPNEMLVPPEGVYGFSLGISAGFDMLPSGLPISGSITEGLWEPHKEAIRYYYDLFMDTRFLVFGHPLWVNLVDPETGEYCHEDWPLIDGERGCVIQFGESDWSHLHSGTHMAYSICTALGGCEIPLSWPMSGTAIALGAYRDSAEVLCKN